MAPFFQAFLFAGRHSSSPTSLIDLMFRRVGAGWTATMGYAAAEIAALRAGSAERAESAMRLHVLTARDYLIEVMRERD